MSNSFICDICDYTTSKKYNYNRHILNDKHKRTIEIKKKEEYEQRHHCKCGKNYKHKPNFYNHRKKCPVYNSDTNTIISDDISCSNNMSKATSTNAKNRTFNILNKNNKMQSQNIIIDISNSNIKKDDIINIEEYICNISSKRNNLDEEHIVNNVVEINHKSRNYNEIIEYLISQNNDLKVMLFEQQKQITELIPKVGNTTLTTNNTNNFNISIFLNEKCKNAVSITDFINNIDVTMNDLIHTKEKGLADGLSNIFIENMNKLSIYQRPIHCTDIKREVLYIKSDTWEKDENKEKIRNALQIINHKQVKSISKINKPNKIYLLNDKEKDEYFAIIKNVTNPLDENENKIIKNLCKNTYINNFDKIKDNI